MTTIDPSNHYGITHKMVARRVANPSDIEDVVQDTMLQAVRKSHLYDPERGAESTWMSTVAVSMAGRYHDRNKVVRRGAGYRHRPVLRSDASRATTPEDAAESRELAEIVFSMLNTKEREMFAMRIAGFSLDEIALRFGVKQKHVRTIMSEARVRVRREFAESRAFAAKVPLGANV